MSLSALVDIAADVFNRLTSVRPVVPPSTVLTDAKDAPGPEADEDEDEGDDLWLLWEAAAPLLANARVGAPVTDADRDQWAGWLAWAIGTMNRWEGPANANDRAFDVSLILLDLSLREDPTWAPLPPALAANTHLRDAVAARIDQLSGQVRAVDAYGLSLRAIRRDLVKPNGAEGWADLIAVTGRLYVMAPGRFRALVRLQYRLWPTALAQQVGDWTDPLAAMALVQELGEAGAFALSAASGNPLLGFAAICAHTELRTPLDIQAERGLEHLLMTVAQDPVVWRGWMAALNRYPVRHPRLQAPLGRALAHASEEAFETWLAALELRPLRLEDSLGPVQPGDGARACLQAFAVSAVGAVRVAGWRAVWRRWNDWNFAEREGLMKVHGSEIDLGVVGYALEVFDASELEATIRAEAAALEALFAHRWSSTIDLMTAINRNQSRLQPLAHAGELRRTSSGLKPAVVRYAISDPDLEWRLRRAGCS